MMATQVAYLNFNGDGHHTDENVSDMVERILTTYGTYDESQGIYVVKDGISAEAKAQFDTALNILTLSEQNHVGSWKEWKIVDACDQNETTGFYGCLIDTGDGDAIVGFRGSESYDATQVAADWGLADVGLVNNVCTIQQYSATEYMKYLYKKYGDSYDGFTLTGHSLGGNLAEHALITAPDEMIAKIERAVSYDGPGFSDEYLLFHAAEIFRTQGKLYHYEWSWVGSLLFQPPGTCDKTIKAHNDDTVDGDLNSMLHRHATYNVEFDENGNVQPGERGILQILLDPASKALEIRLDDTAYVFIILSLASFLYAHREEILNNLQENIQMIKDKANELYTDFAAWRVSGEYEVNLGQFSQLQQDLNKMNKELNSIAELLETSRKNLPYDSVAANYYKNNLLFLTYEIQSEAKKAVKISNVVNQAASKYSRADQKVSESF
jgi:hypothetical protein